MKQLLHVLQPSVVKMLEAGLEAPDIVDNAVRCMIFRETPNNPTLFNENL